MIPIYARTPCNMAQSFATLDEFSGGRAVAGLGVSHKPVVEGWYGQSIDKPLRRDPRVRGHHARDLPRRGSASGREVPHRLPLHGLRAATPRPADLPRRPVPRHAPPRRRDRRRRDPVALQPALHPRRGGADSPRGAREGRQGHGRVRHRRGSALCGERRPDGGPRPAALRARHLLPTAVLPSDARALRLRPGRRRHRRVHPPARRRSAQPRTRSSPCATTATAARPPHASAASRAPTSTPRSRR